jgi:hypothetical protein
MLVVILEAFSLRLSHILITFIVLLGAASASGHFDLKLDTDIYVDANEKETSFDDSEVLWVTSVDDKPVQEAYIGFVNNFQTAAVFSPDQIESATLKIYAREVKKPGEVTAYFLHGATMPSWNWEDKEAYDKNAKVTVDVDKDGLYTLNATDIVKKAVETCTEGCPFSVVLVADGNASLGFASSEGSKKDMPALSYVTSD